MTHNEQRTLVGHILRAANVTTLGRKETALRIFLDSWSVRALMYKLDGVVFTITSNTIYPPSCRELLSIEKKKVLCCVWPCSCLTC